MALSLGGTSALSFSTASGTLSHIVDGASPLLIATMAIRGTATIGTFTYAGNNLTRAVRGVGPLLGAEVWYLENPPAGTANIIVTKTTNNASELVSSTWNNALTSSSLDVAGSNGGTLGTVLGTLTTNDADVIVSAMVHETSTNSTPNNLTSISITDQGVWHTAMGYLIQSGGGAGTFGWNNSNADTYAHAFASFKPAATSVVFISSKTLLGVGL